MLQYPNYYKNRLTRAEKLHLAKTERKWLARARKEYPHGTYCSHCGKINHLVDDVGWFFTKVKCKKVYDKNTQQYSIEADPDKEKVACENCFDWSKHPPGER